MANLAQNENPQAFHEFVCDVSAGQPAPAGREGVARNEGVAALGEVVLDLARAPENASRFGPLSDLPAALRQFLLFRAVEGLEVEEISRRTGRPVEAVRADLADLKSALQNAG